MLDQFKRPYCFEEICCSDASFAKVLEDAWFTPQEGCPMVKVCRKIRDSGGILLNWGRSVFNGRSKELEDVRQALDVLLQKPFDIADQSEKYRLSQRLNELVAIDEVY
ncbi:hypothetical protein ACLB2K_003571 [Fragaria x ananassa]